MVSEFGALEGVGVQSVRQWESVEILGGRRRFWLGLCQVLVWGW